MLERTLATFFKYHGLDRSYWLAYSGGLDSAVLLHLCVKLRKQFSLSLKAIHIHHGLSAQADHWLAHCREVCAQQEVDFIHFMLDTKPSAGESLEAFARKYRYEKFAQVLAPGDMLLTAHHQDDQAETVLLQLIRGAGPKGLSAMPEVKAFAEGMHGRPLLAFPRAELKAYAEVERLGWIEDELNIDPHYSRNYLRHEIMPILKNRWPTVSASIARAAENCAETQALLAHFAALDLEKVQGSKPNTLSLPPLLALPPLQQRLVLRLWFERQQVLLPSSVKLHQILQDVLQAGKDRFPLISWGGVELRRYQNELYLLPSLLPHDNRQIYSWDLNKPLFLPGLGKLTAYASRDSGLSKSITTVEVRFRQGGESYRLARGNHHALKKFFQEQKILPWVRDRLPLLYVKGELAAIPGHLIVDHFKAQAPAGGYELSLTT